jgi:hypothetical protein
VAVVQVEAQMQIYRLAVAVAQEELMLHLFLLFYQTQLSHIMLGLNQ